MEGATVLVCLRSCFGCFVEWSFCIEVTSFSSSIKEDSKIGTTVALISVSDSDSGINGKVICTIKQEVPFTLAPSLQENMYAVVTNHSLTLTALDGGKPPKSGDMNILVRVLDINDNAPVFSKDDYSVALSENAPVGTTVTQVNATDLDEGPNGEVIYSFSETMNQNILNLFDINPLTGEITVKGLINYEEKDRYEIEIQASDKGLAPLTTEKSSLSIVLRMFALTIFRYRSLLYKLLSLAFILKL
uniref:Cadherin domain-containing protein n=1 Tax=Stegastes partitus TaxID=144197 RepID=A0A3B4Z9V2_9TELE